jgi:hypothetical protein
MAKTTRDLAGQEERHHQDGAMPICLLEESAGSRGDTVELRVRDNGGQTTFEYQIYGPIRNIGQGPALNLRLVLRFPTFNNHEMIHELDPLGAGEARGIDSAIAMASDPFTDFFKKQLAAHDARRIAVIPITPVEGFNDATVRMSQDAWGMIFLEYTDIFGNRFYTQHCKNPQHQWMQFGKAPRPAPVPALAAPLGNNSVVSVDGRQ